MERAIRILNHVLIGLAVTLGLVLAVFLIITATPWGLERLRSVVVGALEERIDGEVRIERITARRLLAGATFHGVEIDDPRGRPFVRIDSLSARYHWRTLIAGDVVLDRATIYRPRVVLEHLPVDTAWNFQIIFPETVPDPERRLILFERARIIDGQLTVRTPWEPEPPVEPEDTARMILVPAPGGLVREFRFESLNALLPRVLWESPDEIGHAFEVASLATHGFIWDVPFDLRDLRGTATFRDTVIAFDVPFFELPDSRASALGEVVTGQNGTRFDVRIQSPRAALRDLQWLYPPLPDEGGGRLVFRIQSQEPRGTLWYASDAHIQAPGTELAGEFGIVTGDTLYFTRVSLRASPLNLELLERVLPVDLPVEGLLVGTVVLEGPISSLSSQGDLMLARRGGGDSALRWTGRFDLRPPYAIHTARADLHEFDLGLLAPFAPAMDLAGRVTGRVGASGRVDREIRFSGSLSHALDGRPPSRLEGEGTISRAGMEPTVNARIDGHPFDLDALGAMLPGLDRLYGTIQGPVTVRGTSRTMEVEADLATAFGGLRLAGTVDRTDAVSRYTARGRADGLRLDQLLEGLPAAEISGAFRFEGSGDSPDELAGTLEVEIDATDVSGIDVTEARIRITASDGLARIDLLEASGPAGRLSGRGEFGLVAGRSGTIQLALAADSLGALSQRFFPDTLLVMNGETDAPMSGAASAEVVLEGGFDEFTFGGHAEARDLRIGDVALTRARADFDGRRGAGGLAARAEVHASALELWGRLVNELQLSGDYEHAAGNVRADVRAPVDQRYIAAGSFALEDRAATFELAELELRTTAAPWRLVEPARGRVGRDGLELKSWRLAKSDGMGRLSLFGRLPWAADPGLGDDPVDFVVELDGLPLVDFLRIARPDPILGGTITRGRIHVTGAAGAPVARGDLDIADFRVADARVERVEARLSYGDRALAADVEAVHEGRTILTGSGMLPLDLALSPVEERWTPRPLRFDVRLDAMPAAVPAALLDELRQVEGTLEGSVAVGGTLESPTLGGSVALRGGAVSIPGLGVRYRDVDGSFHLLDDGIVEVDARLRAGRGSGAVQGTVSFRPLSDPAFDLVLRGNELDAARRRDVELTATGELRLAGRYRRPVVTGSIRTDGGVLYLDELARQQQVVELGAPFLFQVVDTSIVSVREFLPASENPFLRNLLVDATVSVPRDLWARGRDLNAELGGDVIVRFDRQSEDLRLFGSLNVLRGHYTLYGRRFEVRRGSLDFTGGPGMNPNLDIVAGYRARTVSGDPLEIRAAVTGTLHHPRVALNSDIEPPLSQSDLASYLIFGRPTDALAPGESGALVRGLVGPTFFGYAASGIEALAADNLGLDYLAITTLGTDPDLRGTGLDNFLAGSQVEFGRYVSENVFLAFTERVGMGSRDVRLEWRFRPTWTAELFGEDRFARAPAFGRSQPFEFRTVYGFFLYREWGY